MATTTLSKALNEHGRRQLDAHDARLCEAGEAWCLESGSCSFCRIRQARAARALREFCASQGPECDCGTCGPDRPRRSYQRPAAPAASLPIDVQYETVNGHTMRLPFVIRVF